MLTREELEGRWNEIRGELKKRWGQLTDDELAQAEGNTDRLVGLVQRKTGESREQIVKFLDSLGEDGSYVDQAAHTAKRYAHEASQAMQQGYEQASEQLQQGYIQAEEMVRRNPLESLAVAFGTGLITGVLVGVILRSR